MVAGPTETGSWILVGDTPNVISVYLLLNTQTFHKILFRRQAAQYSVKSAWRYHTAEGGKLQNISCDRNSVCTINTVQSHYEAS
jgi:hypothetical protein